MRRLIRACREEILPIIDWNIIALIEVASELIVSPGRELPFKIRDISSKQKNIVKNILSNRYDWASADATILGTLYESLLESKSERKSKQTGRRKSGSFFTPAYITDFLVESAFKACSVEMRINEPVILDPACGAGAFLIAAYRILTKKFPEKSPSFIATKLIRGIDIDENAIHITRLSLWIESGLSRDDWKLLGKNIFSGDSIREGISGKIDRVPVVVANPPYRNVKRGIESELAKFCKSNFETARGQWDLSGIFIELALKHLLIPGGACGFIVPSPILNSENYELVRKIILEHRLVSFGPAGAPFHDPGVEASLIVAANTPSRKLRTAILRTDGHHIKAARPAISPDKFHKLPFRILSHLLNADAIRILDSHDSGILVRLGELAKFTRGIECGKKDLRVKSGLHSSKSCVPLLTGETVAEFHAVPEHSFDAPAGSGRVSIFKNPDLWTGREQLLLRRVAHCPISAVASPPCLVLNTLYVIKGTGFDPYALCGVLNSLIFRDLFKRIFAFDDRMFPYIRISQISNMPVPTDALNDRRIIKISRKLHGVQKRNPNENRRKEFADLRGEIDIIVAKYYRE